MPNVLFIKLSSNEVVIHSRGDQNYANAAYIAMAAVLQALGPGKTITAYAIAEGLAVEDYVVDHAVVVSDLSVSEKDEVPGGRVIFPPEDIAIEDIPGDQSVLHGPA